MRDPVTALLRPRSVAVIGASTDPLKRGYQAIKRLQLDGYEHPIYPVNPTAERILGLPVYPDIEAVDGEVDLALVVTPAPLVPDLLHACGRKGVGAAVVIAVGFGETGEAGLALEEEVAAAAAAHGMALVGPNTNGVFHLPERLNLVGVADVPAGPLALLCQSGNVGLSLFADANAMGAIGFSSYVGIGNEAGLRYHELLPHLGADPHTAAVAMYAEGFRDGRAFLVEAAKLARRKPIAMYKAGRSEAARRSALSHTGAIAGRPEVADALLRQAGIEVVERSDELLAVADALLHQPPLGNGRIAVLADGGGHATIAADALGRHGMELAELDPHTEARLASVLPPAASTRNPVDVAGGTDRDPTLFETCVAALLADDDVAGVLCVGLLGGYGFRFSDALAADEEAAASGMAAQARAAGKALVVQSAYAHHRPPAHDRLREAGVGVHRSVETAVRCLSALRRRGTLLASANARSSFELGDRPPGPAADGDVEALTEPVGRELVARHGVEVGPWELVTDAAEAGRAVERLGGRVAMKVVSPDVVHKSDVGGVLLDVEGAAAARDAFGVLVARVSGAVPDATIDGVLVVPMAPPGSELLLGATTDPTFGPVLTVGAGGTAVEVLGDAAFRALPVTRAECHEMLDELRIAPLLAGHRGSEAIDRPALVELMLGVSALVAAEPDVVELDLNPVIAHAGGAAVVDVRVVARNAGSGLVRRGRKGAFAHTDA
jgi:acetate---CoA ligase (ADP-forming)